MVCLPICIRYAPPCLSGTLNSRTIETLLAGRLYDTKCEVLGHSYILIFYQFRLELEIHNTQMYFTNFMPDRCPFQISCISDDEIFPTALMRRSDYLKYGSIAVHIMPPADNLRNSWSGKQQTEAHIVMLSHHFSPLVMPHLQTNKRALELASFFFTLLVAFCHE